MQSLKKIHAWAQMKVPLYIWILTKQELNHHYMVPLYVVCMVTVTVNFMSRPHELKMNINNKYKYFLSEVTMSMPLYFGI